MNPKLIGNPLIAWREDRTLQIGWGEHAVVVQSAPDGLPNWVRSITGMRSRASLMSHAERMGVPQADAGRLLRQLQQVGLVAGEEQLRVAVAGQGLHEPLTAALRQAGVAVVPKGQVVVFPQGQVPSLTAAPVAERLIPVWFSGSAVHVGPILDQDRGPCPRCVDLTWVDRDPYWPRLVAQAITVGTWGQPAQMVQAAAAIALLGPSPSTVGLEMILDAGNPGPCWRVWTPHARCACH